MKLVNTKKFENYIQKTSRSRVTNMSGKQKKGQQKQTTTNTSQSQANYMKKPPSDQLLKETFEAFDRDGDGKISASEIAVVEKILGQNPSTCDVKRFVRRTDGDSSGDIDFREFVKSIKTDVSSTQNYFMVRFKTGVLHNLFCNL